MGRMIVPSDDSSSRQPTILYEAHHLAQINGTGIATYARTLAQAAGRLGYGVNGLFGVERGLARGDQRLNEVLAFDAIGDNERPTGLQRAWREFQYLFSAIRGLRPLELPRSGLVVGPSTDALQPFQRVFAATRLIDASMMHFKIYGRLAKFKLSSPPGLFHVTHPLPLAARDCPNIYTIHDLVPLRLPYATLDNKRYFYRMLMALSRTADHIVTVSEYSRRDIIDHLGIDERRVTNTYQAVDIPPHILGRKDDAIADDLAKHFGLELRGYFLFCGAIEPKKNVSNLIDAYSASGSSLPLIIAGSGGWHNRMDLRKIRDERFVNFRIDGDIVRRQRQVRRLEFLPRDRLLTLIQGARALLFPSIYEGFGLPVIEAMALGTPALTSTTSSLPEVAGDAALLVDPHSVDDISQGIRALEVDTDLRHALVERGREQAKKFSPGAYDVRLKQLYASLM
jgi:glycosyltransferase involved in cell wall biosynthesis